MTAPACPYSIRWGTSAETTTRCDREPHDDSRHEGPGIVAGQRVTWYAGDRREYTGDWPGYCDRLGGKAFLGGCTLPAGHRGNCAP